MLIKVSFSFAFTSEPLENGELHCIFLAQAISGLGWPFKLDSWHEKSLFKKSEIPKKRRKAQCGHFRLFPIESRHQTAIKFTFWLVVQEVDRTMSETLRSDRWIAHSSCRYLGLAFRMEGLRPAPQGIQLEVVVEPVP